MFCLVLKVKSLHFTKSSSAISSIPLVPKNRHILNRQNHTKLKSRRLFTMVNATKGLYITCDIPMAQFIVNMNETLPQSQKFIIQVLDNTHIFVRSDVAGMIRSAIATFREQNTYEKPA